MSKKVKYLPSIGLVRKEIKILSDCGEKQSCNVCEKAAECKQKKIESETDEFKKKYPKIAKMTVAEVVATDMFAEKLKSVITNYRILDYYAFKSLKRENIFEAENFRKEYIACMDKESKMPYAKRFIVLDIGNTTYRRTVTQMMRDYDKARNSNKLN